MFDGSNLLWYMRNKLDAQVYRQLQTFLCSFEVFALDATLMSQTFCWRDGHLRMYGQQTGGWLCGLYSFLTVDETNHATKCRGGNSKKNHQSVIEYIKIYT